ncbi:hypothetical protein N665_0038s0029 [Sinapis alba]|nr:hypothetical protein N665_0038s0029 [Sinapis alba]
MVIRIRITQVAIWRPTHARYGSPYGDLQTKSTPGSYVDVIFKDTLMKMDVKENKLRPKMRPLISFGETTVSEGTVKLLIHVGNIHMIVKFMIIYKPAIYNTIPETPWIHSMKPITSTYHQYIKIPSQNGIYTIRGSQSASRASYVTEQKSREQKPHQYDNNNISTSKL